MRWEPLDGESARAYEAFALYRDLGPDRSIERAWHADSGSDTRPPGHWYQWSGRYEWVARAAAYDAHLDEQRRVAREAALRRLETRRADLEIAEQERLEGLLARIDTLIERAANVEAVEGGVLGGVARLLKERLTLSRQAILGVREERPDADESNAPTTDGPREFTWAPPTNEEPSNDES